MTALFLKARLTAFQLNTARILAIPQRQKTLIFQRLFATEMSKNQKKAVVFDLGGVVFEPPQNALRKYGERLGLHGFMLEKALIRGRPDNAFCRMERGELTAIQFAEEFMKDFEAVCQEEGQEMPKHFDARDMFDSFMNVRVIPEMLNAIAVLREHGIKTAALTNNYIDDREINVLGAGIKTTLRSLIFDQYVESCRFGQRKPDQSIYNEALKILGVKANETVFLDDIGPNVKAARAMGISTILVKDKIAALNELKEITEIDVFREARPLAVHPDRVPHSYVTTRSGVRFHYVDVGSGPPVILCHGFPESWYEWTRQIPALVSAGFRVIAMDMKGYGESSNPPEIEEYCQERLCKDMAEFMDALCIPQATFIGHDFGGMLVWFFATHYADRVSAVAGLCTPFMPPHKGEESPMEKMKKNPRRFDYQLYFNEVGRAEAEIEANLEKFVKTFIRRVAEAKALGFKTSNVRERGGVLASIPDDVQLSEMLTEDDLKYYVKQMKTSGLRSMLNWYRNIDTNWRYNQRAIGRKLYMPALMVTCGLDGILTPEMSRFMEPFVVNLTRSHIEDSGHWVANEQPKQLNKILVDWLTKVHSSSSRPLLPSNL